MNDYSNPAQALTTVEDELQLVLRTTEVSVAALIKAFRELTAHSETILQLAASIVDCVEGDRVSSVLPQVGTLGAVARQYVNDRLQATSGILDTVGGEIELLQQLAKVTAGQAKIAQRIKALNIFTRIEVAHLGEVGAGFEYLARELGDFSQSLVANTDQLGRQTHERKRAIEQTRLMLAAELPVLRRELTRVEGSLQEDLGVLDTGIASLAKAPAQFQLSAASLDRQIAGVVVAVQGHDITRQQIEHVCEGAQVIRQMLPQQDLQQQEPAGSRTIARIHAGLAVQAAQLKAVRQTVSDWTAQIGLCLESILTISASELVEIGPMVREQEQSLIAHLANIELLEQECESYSGKIRGTLEGIANLSQLVTEHMKKSESARSRLQLLTFNSIVEATRLGAKADTICVIADDIGVVSDEWSKITERSGSALDGILRLSAEIGDVMSVFSNAGGDQLKEAQGSTRRGLDGLREAAAFAMNQGLKIANLAEEMRQKSALIRAQAEELDHCFGSIDAGIDAIERIKQRFPADDPVGRGLVDGAEIERIFAASYTTETERNVLRATIYGADACELAPSAVAGEIELF